MKKPSQPRPKYQIRSDSDSITWTNDYPVHVRFLAKKFNCPEAAIEIIGHDYEPCVYVRGVWSGYVDCYWNEIQGLPEEYEGEYQYYMPVKAA